MQQIKERGLAAIEAIRDRNADKDPDEILSEVTALVEEVRQEIYDREQSAVSRSRKENG